MWFVSYLFLILLHANRHADTWGEAFQLVTSKMIKRMVLPAWFEHATSPLPRVRSTAGAMAALCGGLQYWPKLCKADRCLPLPRSLASNVSISHYFPKRPLQFRFDGFVLVVQKALLLRRLHTIENCERVHSLFVKDFSFKERVAAILLRS